MSVVIFGSGKRITISEVVPPTIPESISIALSDTSFVGQQSGTSTRTLTLTRVGGYSGTVSFSVSGLPTGTTASFSPTTLSGGDVFTVVTLAHAVDASVVTSDAFVITASGSGVSDVTANATVTVSEPQAWQLPAGNFVEAKMPLRVIYPRPDAETYAHARHRKAYPGMVNRIPVVAQGGAYPFHYEIISGPAGATIGATIADANYGVWQWTPAAEAAPQNVVVRITDQELTSVDVTWSVEADIESFIFINPAIPTSGTGTFASPFKLWPDAVGTSYLTTTNADKILVCRGGTHNVVGFSDSGNNFRFSGRRKPHAWIGYPGESVTLDFSTAAVNSIAAQDGNDLFIGNIECRNSRPDMNDSRFFFFSGNAGHRSTWHEVEFNGQVSGVVGNDNPGSIVMFDSTNFRENISVISCSADNYGATAVGSIYATRYGVVDEFVFNAKATVVNVPLKGIWLKAYNSNWTVRRCRSIGTNFPEGVLYHGFSGVRGGSRFVEMCYNFIVIPYPPSTTPNADAAIRVSWGTIPTDPGSQGYFYRNTIVGRVSALDNDLAEHFIEKNIVINDSANPANSLNASTLTTTDNVTSAHINLSTILDPSTYLLTGSARTTYLGTHGHEISA